MHTQVASRSRQLSNQINSLFCSRLCLICLVPIITGKGNLDYRTISKSRAIKSASIVKFVASPTTNVYSPSDTSKSSGSILILFLSYAFICEC